MDPKLEKFENRVKKDIDDDTLFSDVSDTLGDLLTDLTNTILDESAIEADVLSIIETKLVLNSAFINNTMDTKVLEIEGYVSDN